MPMSDLLLQIIAVRLGALVLAGLLLQALPEPRALPHRMPITSPARLASAPDPTAHTNPLWRDLRLHD